ncbi:hypothetical protein C8F01DRAFT_1210307 [Mycena amicta]|nr:hypothetical protein C8F01DRAFT_1210307 [Mycena amicta]
MSFKPVNMDKPAAMYTPGKPPTQRKRRTTTAVRDAAMDENRPPLTPLSQNLPAAAANVSSAETKKLAEAIELLKRHGFSTVFEFMDAYLGATDQQQKAAATRLINDHGVHLLEHLHGRRPELVNSWIESVQSEKLEKEVKKLAETLRPQYGERVTAILHDSSIDSLLLDAEAIAPTLFSGLRSAGAMPEDLADNSSRKEHRAILATIISMLCYAQNEKASSFRLSMSIFLLASSASRALFDVLHHAGLCLSYTHTIAQTKTLTTERLQHMLHVVRTSVVMIIWDNLNIAFRVGQERTDSRDHFDNGTTATMIPLFGVKPGDLPLSLLSPLKTATPNLEFRLDLDYLPTPTACKALQDAHIWHLEDILLTQFPELRDKFQSVLTPPPTDIAIPVHKTEQFPLPAMEIDESTIDGTIQVVDTIMRTLKLDTPEALEKHGVVFGAGDLLSLELLLKASGSRRESKDMVENLSTYVKGSLGLFHAKMAGFKCIGNEYWGTPNSSSPWSLWRVNTLLGRKAITAGWKAKKLPPYRPITELILDISLPANILDAFRIHCGRHELDDWVSCVTSYSEITELAHKVYRKLCSAREAARLRALPESERDVPLENIILFNRDALTMRVLRTAVKAGHIGMVITVLRHWMVMFRGSGRMPKYANALFHVLIDLPTMHPTLRNAFLMNWLVNLSGKPNGFKELDLLQEHQNFWLKVIYTAKGVNRSWKWLGMISVSIFTLRDVIRQVQGDYNTPYNGMTHTSPSTNKDLAVLREYLEKQSIQTHTPHRAGNKQATPARDLMAEGVKYANGANPLREFRADRRKARNLGIPKAKATEQTSDSEDEIGLDDLAMDEEEFPRTMDAHNRSQDFALRPRIVLLPRVDAVPRVDPLPRPPPPLPPRTFAAPRTPPRAAPRPRAGVGAA